MQSNKVNQIEAKKIILLEEIESIDKLEFQGLLTEAHHQKRISLKSDLLNIENKQAQIWYQKSRQKWNLWGDENSAYFRRVCTINQRNNLITYLCGPNGNNLETIEAISDAFQLHYKNLYLKTNFDEVLIDNLDWQPISSSQHPQLCKPFDDHEIKKTIRSISNEKALGLDGFTMLLYKKC